MIDVRGQLHSCSLGPFEKRGRNGRVRGADELFNRTFGIYIINCLSKLVGTHHMLLVTGSLYNPISPEYGESSSISIKDPSPCGN